LGIFLFQFRDASPLLETEWLPFGYTIIGCYGV
jgi:hypothetical protein